MRKAIVLAALFALPGALAVPLPGAAECATANDALDQVSDDAWYETCGQALGLASEPSLHYTQVTLGCEGNACSYRPTMEIQLDAVAPGAWELRATSLVRHHPGGHVIPGTERELACALEGPAATCSASVANRDVVGNPLNSARWEGAWALYLVDPTGEEHLQATGVADGWLAQYY